MAVCLQHLFKIFSYYDNKLFNKHKIDNVKNSKVSLVVRANYEGWAFTIPRPTQARRLLKEDSVKIVYINVNNIDEIAKAITKLVDQRNRVNSLTIQGHSDPTTIQLGEESNNKISAKKRFNFGTFKEAINKLEKDAVINLECCETGYIDEDGKKNLGQVIAQTAKGRVVNAPRLSPVGLLVERKIDNGKLVSRFYDWKWSDKGIIKRIISVVIFINLYIYTGINWLKKDVTVQFKSLTEKQALRFNKNRTYYGVNNEYDKRFTS